MWYKYLENNTFIQMIFQIVPDLNNIQLLDIDLQAGNERIRMLFEMDVFVDFPPKKWGRCGKYRILFCIDFFCVKEIIISSKFLCTANGVMQITPIHDGIQVEVLGDVNLKFSAACGIIQSIKNNNWTL